MDLLLVFYSFLLCCLQYCHAYMLLYIWDCCLLHANRLLQFAHCFSNDPKLKARSKVVFLCNCLVIKTFVCTGCMNPVISAGCTGIDIGGNANLELVDKFCYLGDMLSVDGDANTAVEARVRVGWNKLRQLVPVLTSKDVSLIVSGSLHSSCVRSSMLHGSETWPARKDKKA